MDSGKRQTATAGRSLPTEDPHRPAQPQTSPTDAFTSFTFIPRLLAAWGRPRFAPTPTAVPFAVVELMPFVVAETVLVADRTRPENDIDEPLCDQNRFSSSHRTNTVVDAHQDKLSNPFSMDADCRNCPALADCREQVVHGYGDVGAEFVFVGESPSAAAEANGVPFTGDAAGERLQRILSELGFSRSPPDAPEPDLQNAYLTHLTRCRHPERRATDEEIRNCEPFLNAELRMINPHIIVPMGDRALRELAIEYTTRKPDSFDVCAEHATTIRGRGFELVPMIPPADQTNEQEAAFVEHVLENVFSRDYRQTKGRRNR